MIAALLIALAVGPCDLPRNPAPIPRAVVVCLGPARKRGFPS